ncbi:tetratricopeptide repeat protein [Mucilaginibacter sp. AW1-3]
MRLKFLITGMVCLVSATTLFAQKGELNTATEEYGSFSTLRGQKAGPLAEKAKTSLNNAKASIDKASTNAKTNTLPATFAVKAQIYASLALREQEPAAATPYFATAEEALAKAKELDTKGENKKAIDEASDLLGQFKYYDGVKQYQAAKYEAAYNDFDYFRTTRPDDTTALYLTGLSAAAAQKYDMSIKYYSQLIKTKYSKNPDVYADLSLIYLQKKDTASAIKVVAEGAEKFPNDNKLSKREIELNLQAGNQAKVLEKIEKAIAGDPKNKTLYYYAGLTYTQTKDFTKAEAMYRKALEIDPNYYEASLNLGYILLNPGITEFNAAQKLPPSKQKEYDAAMARATASFNAAKPVILRTTEINPKSIDALTNLKQCYLGLKDMANATATQKKIDALKQ